jgi:hypothetical protein
MCEQKEKSSFKPDYIFWSIITCLIGLFAFVAIPNCVPRPPFSSLNTCINNLRKIDLATQQWALDHQRKAEDKVTWNDITPYLKNKLECPKGGKYTVGPVVSNVPTCSISGHTLPP